MTKEELFHPSSYFRFINMTDEEGWLYYNLLLNTSEIANSKFVECEFRKESDIVNFNGSIITDEEVRCIRGTIIESDPKFAINMHVTRVLTEDKEKEYGKREVLEITEGVIVNLGEEKIKTKSKRR